MVDTTAIIAERDARIAEIEAIRPTFRVFFLNTKTAVSTDDKWKRKILDDTLALAQKELEDQKADINQMTIIATDDYGNDREAELKTYIAGLTEQMGTAVAGLDHLEAAKQAEQMQATIDLMKKEAAEEHALKEKNMAEIVARSTTRIDGMAKILDDAAAWVVARPISEEKKAAKIAEDMAQAELIAQIAVEGKPWAVPSDEQLGGK
jgi:hypothetical protein